jgi:hypothetical protein
MLAHDARSAGSWTSKDASGAPRLGCMACGAHALLGGAGSSPRCPCCAGTDLRSVFAAELAQHTRDRRTRALRRRLRPAR